MKEIKIGWEPKNSVDLDFIESQLSVFFDKKKGGMTLLRNGTILFVHVIADPEGDAKRILEENTYLVDFKVAPIGPEGYLVMLNAAIAVYVGAQEFLDNKETIKKCIDDLKYPTEVSLVPQSWSEDEYLIGLYGRAKYQYDVHNFDFYRRLG